MNLFDFRSLSGSTGGRRNGWPIFRKFACCSAKIPRLAHPAAVPSNGGARGGAASPNFFPCAARCLARDDEGFDLGGGVGWAMDSNRNKGKEMMIIPLDPCGFRRWRWCVRVGFSGGFQRVAGVVSGRLAWIGKFGWDFGNSSCGFLGCRGYFRPT